MTQNATLTIPMGYHTFRMLTQYANGDSIYDSERRLAELYQRRLRSHGLQIDYDRWPNIDAEQTMEVEFVDGHTCWCVRVPTKKIG